MRTTNHSSRFIEMFQDAPKTKLGDFCELKARIGWQGLKHEEFLDNGDYYLVTGVDFTGTSIDWSRCHFVTKERYDQDPYIQLHNGDILVTKDGTIGKVAIVSGLETPATLNSGVFVLRDKKGLTLNSFLFYCLLSKEFERFVEDCKTGSTIAHLNQKAFVNYLIPTPELKAQEQFVSFAKQADKSKFNCFKSRFIEMFDGDKFQKVRLGDYTDLTWGDTNITKNSYVLEGYLAFSAGGPDGKLDHYDYDREGIVLSAIGADCGKTWYTTGKWSCIKNTIRFWSTSEKLDSYFLFLATRDKDYWPRRGGAQPFIPQTDARNCVIPLPPLDLQRQFISLANQADKSKYLN